MYAPHPLNQSPLMRWLLLCGVLCLVLFVGYGGCRPTPICVNDTNDLSLNPAGLPCQTRCDCNNQRYTGRCIEQRCQVTLREGCNQPGETRSCKDKQLTCARQIQRCKPDHLFEFVWGDCTCFVPPQEPKEPMDAGEHNMGGDKQPADTPDTSKEQQPEPTPDQPTPDQNAPEPTPEPTPDTCRQQQEICDDGLDNNCDGKIDEGCTPCAAKERLAQWSGHKGMGIATHHPWKPLVLTGAADGLAKIWDTATGMQQRTLTQHTKAINAVAWSPNGLRIATASDDGSIQLWDGTSYQPLQTLQPHEQNGTPQPVKDVTYHPRGQGFVSIADGPDGVKWWDNAGKAIATLSQTQQAIGRRLMVRFSPDGQWLAILGTDDKATQGVIILWDLSTQPPTYKGSLTGLAVDKRAMAFHPGSQLLIATTAKETQLWDLRNLRVATTWPEGIHAAAWSKDGRQIAMAHDKDVALWHFQQQSLLTRIPTPNQASSLAFSADAGQLMVATSTTGDLQLDIYSCPCTKNGQSGQCYDGTPATIGRGRCRIGTWRCDDQQRRLPCMGLQIPVHESPNGQDDDCDGQSDNGYLDLTVTSLKVTPANGDPQVQRQIQVCVGNQGALTSESNPVQARLYLSTDQQITPNDTPLTGIAGQPADMRWPGLQGSEKPSCQTISLTLDKSLTGTLYIGAIIDHTNEIPETNETNNTKQTQLTLTNP